MQWSYQGDPTRPEDQVRINVGDVREDHPLIDDRLIEGWLAQHGGSSAQASLDAIDYLIAVAMHEVSYSVDGASVQARERLENYKARRTDLLAQSPLDTSSMVVNDSVGAMISADNDADRPAPAFTRGMFQYPGTITQQDADYDSRLWWGWRW